MPETGAVQNTFKRKLPLVAVFAYAATGAEGADSSIMALDGADGAPTPTALVAVTVNV